jgi:hypothetical protein
MLTYQMMKDLQSALRGGGPRCLPAEDAGGECRIGAVWHGDWREKGFGYEGSPVHNACISAKTEGVKRMVFAPITRKKHSPASCIFLPFGTIPGGMLDSSYLLFKRKLRASPGYLREKKFKYKGQLPEVYVREMVSRMEQG